MLIDPDVRIKRLNNRQKIIRRKEKMVIWLCCKRCNEDIPPSKPQHAYCDIRCKMNNMAAEMGLPRIFAHQEINTED